jgi:hypothetical protein
MTEKPQTPEDVSEFSLVDPVALAAGLDLILKTAIVQGCPLHDVINAACQSIGKLLAGMPQREQRIRVWTKIAMQMPEVIERIAAGEEPKKH